MNDQRLAIMLLGALGMATAFMPWVKMPLIGYEIGTNYSGWITFFLFLIPFIVPFFGERSNVLKGIKLYGICAVSLIAAAVGVWEIIDLDGPLVSVDYGLYLMTLTGVVVPLAAFIIGKRKMTSTNNQSDNYSYNTEIEKKGAPD